jgi:hypothetical protein
MCRSTLRSTTHRDCARLHHFYDAKWFKRGDHTLDLSLIARDFYRQRLRADVHGSRAENLHEVEHISALRLIDSNFNERKITDNSLYVGDVLDT